MEKKAMEMTDRERAAEQFASVLIVWLHLLSGDHFRWRWGELPARVPGLPVYWTAIEIGRAKGK